MTAKDSMHPTCPHTDELLGDIISQLTGQLEQGTPIDLSCYERQYPQFIDQIRLLLPTLETLVYMGHPPNNPSDSSGHLHADSGVMSEKRLGDYRIIEKLGQGGMGVVYRAEQISLQRTVALKVLPFAAVMDEKAITRFKNEARAAGTLHHDNIVPVHGVGTERGVHYYAMALINGVTMADVIHELKQSVLSNARTVLDQIPVDRVLKENDTFVKAAAGISRRWVSASDSAPSLPPPTDADALETVRMLQNALSTRRSLFGSRFFEQVARIGMQTAEALHHAHEHGIVHRDIKPGNLMVDPTGKVWVTDFGLARIESDVGMTMTGDVLGTLRYMAPEQALGKRIMVDHRADIYSLGATLYELLTLRPVFEAVNREELLKQLTFEEPKPIRKVHPAVPVDLETVVMKAIAKDPDERYATASEMADDLRAIRNSQPILAKPFSVQQRIRRWALRHQGLVAAIAAVLLISTLSLVVSTILILDAQSRTTAALGEARQNFSEAKRQQQLADENFRHARSAVDSYLTTISEDILLNNPGMEPLRKELLELALDYYQQFIDDRGEDPDVQAELADAYERAAAVQWQLGHLVEATRAFKNALELRTQLFQRNPNNAELRHALAKSYLNVGQVYDVAESIRNDEKAIETAQPLTDPSHRLTLASAYIKLGQDRVFHFGEHGGAADVGLAHAAFMKAKDILEELDEPSLEDRQLTLANLYDRLRSWHSKFGEPEQVAAYEKRVAEIAQALAEADPQNLRHQQNLALIYEREGDIQKGFEIRKNIAARSPHVVEFQADLAKAYAQQGFRHRKSGNLDEALAAFQKSADVYTKVARDHPTELHFHAQLGAAFRWLGDVQKEAGRTSEAMDSHTLAIGHLEKSKPDGWGHLSDSYHRVSMLHEEAGRLDEAISMQQKRLQVMQQNTTLGQVRYRWIYASAYHDLGRMLRRNNDHDAALAAYQDAIDLLNGDFTGDGTPEQIWFARRQLVKSYSMLAEYLEQLDRTASAEETRHSAVEAIASLQPETADDWRERATLYYDLGMYSNALADVSQAIQLNPRLSSAFNARSRLYRRLGQFDLALADLATVIELEADHAGPAAIRAHAYALRGDIYFEDLAQFENAVAAYTQAMELAPEHASYGKKLQAASRARGQEP
jgi:serine/threonine protein kinase/tetratricopeptide (TPR) repeat protein